eukprot:3461108-Rhodomonas_salina.1
MDSVTEFVTTLLSRDIFNRNTDQTHHAGTHLVRLRPILEEYRLVLVQMAIPYPLHKDKQYSLCTGLKCLWRSCSGAQYSLLHRKISKSSIQIVEIPEILIPNFGVVGA